MHDFQDGGTVAECDMHPASGYLASYSTSQWDNFYFNAHGYVCTGT